MRKHELVGYCDGVMSIAWAGVLWTMEKYTQFMLGYDGGR